LVYYITKVFLHKKQQYNTIQYNIRLLGLDRMQANNTGSGYA